MMKSFSILIPPFVKLSKVFFCTLFLSCFPLFNLLAETNPENKEFIVQENSSFYITPETFSTTLTGGDTIFISSARTNGLKFQHIEGEIDNPVVIINYGGQVKINDPNSWGAITFENCKYIKISGTGHPGFKYGFSLSATQSGLAFTELSTNCEAEFIKIDHQGFFGIYAKKDYGGVPPSPVPVFDGLSIHDCFIQNVTEGMYLGETKTPGMEFTNVEVFNNIVVNTGREAIQIANMVRNVKIYNNTLLNSGQNNEIFQNNMLQIGDNCVADVFNNILRGTPGFAIISLGMGNNFYYNNYIANAKGMFIDNRTVSIENSPIQVNENFFKDIVGYEIIKNKSEVNQIEIIGNFWDAAIDFFKNETTNDLNYTVKNNQETNIEIIEFTNTEENDYSLSAGTATPFLGIGAPGGPEYFDYVIEPDPVPESKQIILNSEMITDEVEGGSYYSPAYLVDEQNNTPENNVHPVSKSWKPYWNMNKAPYHIYIDLKHLYQLTQIALHDMHNTDDLVISIGEPGNWQQLFIESCDKFNTWKIHETNVSTRYIRISMLEGVYAAVNEISIYGYPLVDQIELNASMISDEVEGGSYYSPTFLVDEQNMNPDSEMHPISQSWKPYWNMDKAPYHTVIDLNGLYDISSVWLHDMNNVANLTLEYGEPGNWNTLFIENCNAYKTWKNHEVNISARYLRLSMYESVYAAVNELILYGKPNNDEDILKSASLKSAISENEFEDENIKITSFLLFPNPVEDIIMLAVPEDLNSDFTLEVFDANGRIHAIKEYYNNRQKENTVLFDVSNYQLNSGLYILRFSNKTGISESIRFYKK